jgi:hypothetical protein
VLVQQPAQLGVLGLKAADLLLDHIDKHNWRAPLRLQEAGERTPASAADADAAIVFDRARRGKLSHEYAVEAGLRIFPVLR